MSLMGSVIMAQISFALNTKTCAQENGTPRCVRRALPSASVRAVVTSNGLNALAIIVPCHRVVGADGKLVGYGGGLWRKKRLLELEESC